MADALILSGHPLGFKYNTSPDPYQTDSDTDTGVSYIRYNSGSNRCWIFRVTKLDISETRSITTVEKTYGQWDGRVYHYYVPIHEDVTKDYFDTLNFDTYYVQELDDGNEAFNGAYLYSGSKLTYNSDSGQYTESDTYALFKHVDYSADTPVYGIIVYDTATNSWMIRDDHIEDLEYVDATLIEEVPEFQVYSLT